MTVQPALRRPHALRGARRHSFAPRVQCPTVGQCFDIEVSREIDGWTIRVPEIGAVTHARRRATVEIAARECIAAKTGIPIGYVTVFVATEKV